MFAGTEEAFGPLMNLLHLGHYINLIRESTL
jgi:hypothetical protein